MHEILRHAARVALLSALWCAQSHATNQFGKTFFLPRSQGIDLPRLQTGTTTWHSATMPDLYTSPYIAIQGMWNKPKNLGRYFFFNNTDTMSFGDPYSSGTFVAGSFDVDAINFLLAPAIFPGPSQPAIDLGFSGTIQDRPRVTNEIIELSTYLRLDNLLNGLYIICRLPIAHVFTSLKTARREVINNEGPPAIPGAGSIIPAGLISTMPVIPNKSINQAWNGQLVGGDVKQPMKYGRLARHQSKFGVADIELDIGFDFHATVNGHFGSHMMITIPTGNKPNAHFLFEPVVGSGRHARLGLGINAHYIFWQNACSQSFSMHLDSFLCHDFASFQRRTFPLVNNGPGSQYLLLKLFDANTNLYAGEILYGPNILTRTCDSSMDVEGEVSLLARLQERSYAFDFGIDIWCRSREKLRHINGLPDNTFAIAGRTGVITTAGGTGNNTASTAMINGFHATVIDGGTAGSTSSNVYLRTQDLDASAAALRAAGTAKLFLYGEKIWRCHCWEPYLGVGASAEWSIIYNNALNQWAFWLKGGFTFA